MRKNNQVYFKLGLTLLCVVLASTVFMVILVNLPGFFNVITSFLRIISPLLFGVLFAYLMNPIMQFVENGLIRLIRRWCKQEKVSDPVWMRSRKRFCHVLGVVAALATMLGFFYLIVSLVVPTIVENVGAIFTSDMENKFYNRIIDTVAAHHSCKGEDMFHTAPQYNYGMALDFNAACSYPDGSAIFFHCKGPKPYTGGCIAVDEPFLRQILTTAHPGLRVIIH